MGNIHFPAKKLFTLLKFVDKQSLGLTERFAGSLQMNKYKKQEKEVVQKNGITALDSQNRKSFNSDYDLRQIVHCH